MKKKKRNALASTHSTGLTRIGDVLPQLITRYGIQRHRNIEHIAQVWAKVIGEPFASVTRVAGLNRGTLEITVPHNAFVQELSFRQSELLVKLQAEMTEENIKKVKFVVG